MEDFLVKNKRNAGRKAIVDYDTLDKIKKRVEAGERIASIAKEYGISRQALYKRIKTSERTITTVDYIVNDELSTRIEADFMNESLQIVNYATKISQLAFGVNENPSWKEFIDLLERVYIGQEERKQFICQDSPDDKLSLKMVEKSSDRNARRILCDNEDSVPMFCLNKSDILYSRTDTDGYQLKAISRDRRYFLKSQAIIAGVNMRDWMVEIIVSDLCDYLNIPCVRQSECEITYGGRTFKGVYSKNFELDGYQFVSFERLLERMGVSSCDEEFIHLDALEKLRWCSSKLALAGKLDEKLTLKYMLDLAIVDCMVGNVDRHTRNFGLFYNIASGNFEIPLLFDNGMGLFEHDSYRDNYENFDGAMNNVYVAPYGEDPFEMIRILDKEFDLRSIYPGIDKWSYKGPAVSGFAEEYMRRINELWQKLD